MSTGNFRSGENPVDRLRQEFERWLETAWTQGERAVDAFGLRGKIPGPEVDVVETPDTVEIAVDLPGVDPQAVEITLAGNMLTLKGMRVAPVLAPQDVSHRKERTSGQFSRSIPLPVAVDSEKVSAEAKNGVLIIHLSKEESLKPRQIHVKVKHTPGGEAS